MNDYAKVVVRVPRKDGTVTELDVCSYDNDVTREIYDYFAKQGVPVQLQMGATAILKEANWA